jgi:ferredoxin-NADP reductase
MARKYFQGRVVSHSALCGNVRHIVFEREDQEAVEFKPGQFMMIHFVGREGVEINRSYSMADAHTSSPEFALCVKRVDPDGQGSQLIHALNDGDSIKMSGPFGRFCLRDETPQDLVLVATGTGIAPFHCMLGELKAILAGGERRIWMLFGVRYEDELLYHDTWTALAAQHPNFRYRPVVSRPSDDGDYKGSVGYVSAFEDELRGTIDPDNTVAYLCGVPEMVDDMRVRFKEMGLGLRATRTEKYVSPPPKKPKKAKE